MLYETPRGEQRFSGEAAGRLLALIRRHMLCRMDRLCHRTRKGTPCPLDPCGRLDELLLAHLQGGAGPEARGVSKKRPGGWPTRGPWRIGSYCPTPDGLTLFAVIDC